MPLQCCRDQVWVEYSIHSQLLVPNNLFIRKFVRTKLNQIWRWNDHKLELDRRNLRNLATSRLASWYTHVFHGINRLSYPEKWTSLTLTYVLRADFPDRFYEIYIIHAPSESPHDCIEYPGVGRVRRVGWFHFSVPWSNFPSSSRNLDGNRLVEAYINPPTFTVILQPKVVNHFQLLPNPQSNMKFQLATLIAALSIIAPVLASPAPAPVPAPHDETPGYCKLLISYYIVHSINDHMRWTGNAYVRILIDIFKTSVQD